MQRVTRLVEQGNQIVVVQIAVGLALQRRGEVAHHVRHRRLYFALQFAAHAHFIHPRTGVFARTCIRIEVHATNDRAAWVQHIEILHIFVPRLHVLVALQTHAEQRFDHLEQTAERFFQREIVFHFLLRKRITLLAQFFAGIGHIPRL